MELHKFGTYYINLAKITFVHKFAPEILPPGIPRAQNTGGVRISFDTNELVIYEDEPGYAEFLDWIDQPRAEA